MRFSNAANHFLVILLSASGASQLWGVNYDSSRVCVLEGSTVKLGCIFKYPCETPTIIVEKTFWFTEINNIVDLRDNPDYRDRVEWNPPDYDGYRNCTLTIRRLRRTDSATYKFRFETNKTGGRYTGEPGVDLKVTGLTVGMYPVVTEGQKVILTCDTSCNLPEHTTFTWHQNGKALPQSENQHPNRLVLNTVGRQDAGIYTCYVKNQNFSAPERTLTVQYAPDAPSVSVSPDEIKENSSVTLTCRGDAYPAIQTYTWFKENGNQSLGSETENLVFDHIQSFDSGKYFCTVANTLGSNKSDSILIDVKYAPTNTSLLVSPSDEIKEGDSVTLNCRSDANPPANFTWYKDNQTLPWELRKSYTFTSIRSEDSGTYRCRSENEYGRSYSANLSIAVQYAPRVPSVSGKLEDSWRLTLTCSSDAHPSVDNYTWFKENEDSPRASGRTFTITDFRINQIGNYYCQAQNRRGAKNSTYQLIVVADQQFPVTWVLATAASGIFVILLFIILVSVFVYIRKRPFELHSAPGQTPSSIVQSCFDKEESDLDFPGPLYANVFPESSSTFPAKAENEPQQKDLNSTGHHLPSSKNQEVPYHQNVQPPPPQRQDDVLYAAVKFNTANAASKTRVQTEEVENEVLYKEIIIKPRV